MLPAHARQDGGRFGAIPPASARQTHGIRRRHQEDGIVCGVEKGLFQGDGRFDDHERSLLPGTPGLEIPQDRRMDHRFQSREFLRIGKQEAGQFPAVETAVGLPEQRSEQGFQIPDQVRIRVIEPFGGGV